MKNNNKIDFNLLAEEKKDSETDKTVLLDTDNDGIPDEWEINGYTVENQKIVPWDEQKHANKEFIKYFSDPYDAYSSGGPYSDIEKVLKRIDCLEEAYHPLVATYPKINFEMEKIILSKNYNISQESGTTLNKEISKTVGISTTNSNTNSTVFGTNLDTKIDISLIPQTSFSTSANFSFESSNTVTREKSKLNTLSEQISDMVIRKLELKSTEVAFLNGNIRYTNIGTASIYNLKPTLNFILGIGEESKTIATILAKNDTLCRALTPNNKYPSINQNSLSWNTTDDSNSQPIKLDSNDVKHFLEGTPLQIQAIQIEGDYKKYDISGEQYLSNEFKWEYVLPDIYKKTALIKISFNDGQSFERRVAANKWKVSANSRRKIPNLTIKEAIEIAFANSQVKDNKIYYKNKSLDINNDLKIIISQKTKSVIEEQKKSNFFDNILTKEMQILFLEQNNNQEQIEDYLVKINYELDSFDGKKYSNYLSLNNINLEIKDFKFVFQPNFKNEKLYEIIPILTSFIKNKLSLSDDIKDRINFSCKINETIEWNLKDSKTWYLPIDVVIEGVIFSSHQVHFKNFDVNIDHALPNDSTNKLFWDKICKDLSDFNSTSKTLGLKNFFYLYTDLGQDLYKIQYIIITYLIFKKMIPISIVKNISFIFYNYQGWNFEIIHSNQKEQMVYLDTKTNYSIFNEFISRIYFSEISNEPSNKFFMNDCELIFENIKNQKILKDKLIYLEKIATFFDWY